ncbi:MAG TPA: Crp/Fnr family transcriptional regulator [Chitinophagaceae bacterium]|nr:Crp/Fnr family transcriptional regulator [Chitinophagaceae bacterium]
MKKKLESHLINKYNLPHDIAERVAALFISRKVSRGTVLLRQGEPSAHLFFVAKGCLRSYINDKKGKTQTLVFAPEEWWIGDQVSLFREEPAMFSIDAVEDSEILVADRQFYEKMPGIYDGFYQTCFIYALEHLRLLEKRILCLQGIFGDERYLDFMRSYPELAVRLPQHMIASYLGISRQSLSRIRSKLASNNPDTRTVASK